MTFSDLHLIPQLLQAAGEAGYEEPSPIQAQAIPPVLEGRDLLGCAQTGTGKTAAFAMPILQNLTREHVNRRFIRALVLTPTRELALQIDESFAAYGRHLPLRHCVIFGGVGQAPQVAALKAGVDILTATPGRLNDLIGQGYVDLSHLRVFVLDEADRMLDMGFVHDVKRVIRQIPEKRQTLLFSATMPPEIEALAGTILHDPVKVMVTPPATMVEAIRQSVCFVDKGNKRRLLAALLRDEDVESALVFTRTKHGADRVVKELAREGLTAMAIHGNKSQTARQKALGAFKEGALRVLVATDIAARGIDVSGLSHVFNYDLPNVPETYVHRIGRTGRAGREGIAVSFCCAEEAEYLRDIEKLTRQSIPVQEHAWPPEEPFAPAVPAAKKGRAAPTPTATRKETKTMDEQKTSAPAPAAAGSGAPGTQQDAAKKRRRRGGRRHSKNRGPEAAAAQAPEQKPEKQPGRPPQKKQAEPKAGKKPERPARSQQSRGRAERPTEKAAPKAAPAREEIDDSIQLISRRAPATKFTSFDEYMKAHGLAGDADEPAGEE